jgi:hypothetical protein
MTDHPGYLYAAMHDLGVQLRAERARADALEAELQACKQGRQRRADRASALDSDGNAAAVGSEGESE